MQSIYLCPSELLPKVHFSLPRRMEGMMLLKGSGAEGKGFTPQKRFKFIDGERRVFEMKSDPKFTRVLNRG